MRSVTSRIAPGAGALAALALALEPHPSLAQAVPPAETPSEDVATDVERPLPPGKEWEGVDAVKHPASWFAWGADIRIRNEYLMGATTLDRSASGASWYYWYFRPRVWGTATAMPGLTFTARLIDMVMWNGPFMGGNQGDSWRFMYAVFDALEARWNDIGGAPVSVTLGRQALQYHGGWLLGDGTPLAGPYHGYFDGLHVKWEPKEIATRFDLLGLYQGKTADAWLPTLGSVGNARTNEQRTLAAMVAAENRSLENTMLGGWVAYKNDAEPFANGMAGNVVTIGAIVDGTVAEGRYSYSLEAAYQLGQRTDSVRASLSSPLVAAQRTVSAWAANGRASWNAKDAMKNKVSLVGQLETGDDPSTPDKDEMFDNLWGRWPHWTELGMFSWGPETNGRPGAFNNIVRVGPAWHVEPVSDLRLDLMYNLMWATQAVPTRAQDGATTLFTGTGAFRGHYLQAILAYTFNRFLAAHLWGEWIWQQSYFAKSDVVSFLRLEVWVTF